MLVSDERLDSIDSRTSFVAVIAAFSRSELELELVSDEYFDLSETSFHNSYNIC